MLAIEYSNYVLHKQYKKKENCDVGDEEKRGVDESLRHLVLILHHRCRSYAGKFKKELRLFDELKGYF